MEYLRKNGMLRILIGVLMAADLLKTPVLSNTLPIRLVSGTNSSSGRVEIYYNREGAWGTVCDDFWNLKDATVVCRQLGCGEAQDAPGNAKFGEGSGKILYKVGCSGSERLFSQCSLNRLGTCDHNEDAGVVCTDTAEMPKPSLSSSLPAVQPGDAVTFTCSRPSDTCTTRELQMYRNGEAIRATVYQDSVVLNLSITSDQDQGSYSCGYPVDVADSPISNIITFTVVNLKQPRISATNSSSEEGGALCRPNPQRSEVTKEPQTLEVTKGHNFFIICSSDTQGYTGGSFQLLFSGSNRTWAEPAVQNSACFLFPEANTSHQGNYTCVYEVTVDSRLFTSTQSQPVTITVKDSGLLLPLLLVGGGLLLLLLLTVFMVWRRRLGNRIRKSSTSQDATIPDGGRRYRRNELIEDRDNLSIYASVCDEHQRDYGNTVTQGGGERMEKSTDHSEEEDYMNMGPLSAGRAY